MVSNKLRIKHPDRVPVVVTKDPQNKSLESLQSTKYLIQDHITIGQFMYILRKRIHIDETVAFYLYVNTENDQYLLNTNDEMIAIYNQYRNKKNGLLYLTYTGENVFG